MSLPVQIDAYLRPLGFVRRGSRWNRRGPQYVDVIELQTSKGGVSFTVNVGVLNIEVYEIMHGRRVPDSVSEVYCTVRSRLGRLTENARDRWWGLSEPGVAAVVGESIVKYAVPFCNSMHDATGMIGHINAPRQRSMFDAFAQIQSIILEGINGEHDGACRHLTELFVKVKHERLREIIDAVLGRLGCEEDSLGTGTQIPSEG